MNWQKEYVERLVSPLPIGEGFKDRLREELWGHLAGLYEEELCRTSDTHTARDSACKRLGDLNDLHGAFGIPMLPAAYSANQRRIHAVRAALQVFVGLSLPLVFFMVFTSQLPGMTPASTLVTALTGMMLLSVMSAVVGIVLYDARSDGNAVGPGLATITWRIFRGVSLALSVALAAWLIGYVTAWSAFSRTGEIEMLRVLNVFALGVLIPFSVILAVLVPPLARIRFKRVRNSHRLPDWPYATPA